MRKAFVLIALLVTACGETIVLGTECPSRSGACAKEQLPPGEDGDTGAPVHEDGSDGGELPGPTLDGGSDQLGNTDSGRRDAGRDRDAGGVPILDAHVPEDAGPALFPPFLNPSFELVDGGKIGPVPESIGAAPMESGIAPWYTCRAGLSINNSVTYDPRTSPLVTVYPREGDTFLTDTFPYFITNLNGLAQYFVEPLKPARHYAFAVDLYAQPDLASTVIPNPGLVLDLSTADALGCFFGRKLASSVSVPAGVWTKVCLDFVTPPEGLLQSPIRGVMMQAGATIGSFSALHIDNIREDPTCP